MHGSAVSGSGASRRQRGDQRRYLHSAGSAPRLGGGSWVAARIGRSERAMRDILFDFLQAQYGFHFHSRHPIYQKGVTLEYSLCFSVSYPTSTTNNLTHVPLHFLSLAVSFHIMFVYRTGGWSRTRTVPYALTFLWAMMLSTPQEIESFQITSILCVQCVNQCICNHFGLTWRTRTPAQSAG